MRPNITLQPFALDYFQVAFAFFDVLAEVYKRISHMLGPSHFPSPSNMGPSGFGLAPPAPTPPSGAQSAVTSPGLASESRDAYFTHANGSSSNGVSSLGHLPALMPAISISSTQNVVVGGQVALTSYPGSPPPTWSPGYGDMLAKVDSKFMVRQLEVSCQGKL